MKTIHRLLVAAWRLILIAAAVLYAVACTTETKRVVLTDKTGTVTETTTTTRKADPFAFALVETVAEIYAPRRAVLIREEKNSVEIMRLLHGWKGPQRMALTGPISADELAGRRPSN